MNSFRTISSLALGSLLLVGTSVSAQEVFPKNSYPLTSYHEEPRYRESESHPLRVLGYILHPIGWVIQEGITRPLSYFASSSEESRAIMGWREPFDYRDPSCFTNADSVPDCRAVAPFNYHNEEDAGSTEAEGSVKTSSNSILFPDVNFDLDKSSLTPLGEGQTRRLAQFLMENSGGVSVVLEGHADARGSVDHNQALAMARSETVKNELVTLGVPAERLKTVSFGNTKPVFNDSTDWAYAVNRRVSVGVEK